MCAAHLAHLAKTQLEQSVIRTAGNLLAVAAIGNCTAGNMIAVVAIGNKKCRKWIELAQDRDRWQALVNGLMNIRIT
jgi:hypothetical protein